MPDPPNREGVAYVLPPQPRRDRRRPLADVRAARGELGGVLRDSAQLAWRLDGLPFAGRLDTDARREAARRACELVAAVDGWQAAGRRADLMQSHIEARNEEPNS